MDMINNKKNETVVGFPIENLDLTSYFPGENNECVYDLVSVLCHQGSIKQPHYKTIVKNEDNWYEIDDNIIKKLEKFSKNFEKSANKKIGLLISCFINNSFNGVFKGNFISQKFE